MEVWVKIKKVHPDAVFPTYATSGSSGFDLVALRPYLVMPSKTVLVEFGFCVEFSDNYELQIRTRSGLALKSRLIVLNAPGTFDSDYRGQVAAILYNAGEEPYFVNVGDRVAQAVLCPVLKARWSVVETLSETQRGVGGYGSTGH